MTSLTKGALYLVIAQTVFLASTYIVQIGLGRFLGPELYGVYGVLMALITAVTMILTSGMEQAVSKKVSEKRELAYTIKTSALKLVLVLSFILFLIYFASARIIAELLNDISLTNYIRFSALIILVYCIGKVYMGYFNGLQQFKKQSLLLIIFSIAKLVFVFALAFVFLINGIIAGIILASLVSLTASILVSEKGKRNHFKIEELVSFAVPLTIFNIAFTLLFSIDLFLVKSLLKDNVLAGYYNASLTLARSLYFILSAIAFVLLPAVSEAVMRNDMGRAKKLVRTAFRYILMCLIPLCLVIYATSKNFVALFYQSRYLPAAAPLSILIFGSAFLTTFFILATVLMGSGNTKSPMIIVILLVFIDVVLNLLLIPRWSLIGAAIATTIISIIGTVILVVVVTRRFGRFVPFGSLMKISLASLIIYAIALLIPLTSKFLLPLEYIILLIIYFGTLFLLKEFTRRDVELIKDLIPENMKGFLPRE